MPSDPTPRLGLPRPSGNDPADVPADIDALTVKLDAVTATFLSGPASALPAPGIPGRLYFVSDESVILYDTGTGWHQPGYSPGDLKLAAHALAPVGWLKCDGTAVARTTYPELFGAIGTVWGAGDGSSTFNVPDLRGRALAGAGAGAGLSARALGQLFGVEAVAIGVTEMPAHAHSVYDPGHGHPDPGHAHGIGDPGHSHSVGNLGQANAVVRLHDAGGAFTAPGVGTQGTSGAGTGVYVGAAGTGLQGAYTGVSLYNNGGGGAHANVPPSAALTMLIKT